MNSHKNRIRAPRALLVAGCLAALAGPSVAGATTGAGTPWVDPPLRHTIAPAPAPAPYKSDAFAGGLVHPAVAPDDSGARLDHRGLNEGSREFQLPKQFATDTQSSSRGSVPQRYALPAAFKTDVQSSPPTTAVSTSPRAVIREIHSVATDDGQTLAIVLGSVALGIAISGSGYALIRVQRMQRRALGSSS
jgi:hypothetical protein